MRKNSIKNTRINGEVLKELSNIIRGEIKDPRINPMTSVVAVDVAPDLKTAKVYVSIFEPDAEKKVNSFKILCANAGHIRHSLAQVLRLRTVPELKFILDDSMEYGEKIDKLLKNIENEESNSDEE